MLARDAVDARHPPKPDDESEDDEEAQRRAATTAEAAETGATAAVAITTFSVSVPTPPSLSQRTFVADFDAWVFKVNNYGTRTKVASRDMLELAKSCLDQDLLAWWEHHTTTAATATLTWKGLHDALFEHHMPKGRGRAAYEALLQPRQMAGEAMFDYFSRLQALRLRAERQDTEVRPVLENETLAQLALKGINVQQWPHTFRKLVAMNLKPHSMFKTMATLRSAAEELARDEVLRQQMEREESPGGEQGRQAVEQDAEQEVVGEEGAVEDSAATEQPARDSADTETL